MVEKSLQLRILSKDGIRFNGIVKSVTLPSISGEITILPHHISLLSGLGKGKVKLVPCEGANVILQISSGFVRFVNNECILTIAEIKV
jgi:F-type H+-transporting ATPase subunit epsilon